MTLHSLLIFPLPLLVLVLPAHSRVRLLVAPPPGRDDSALQRRMGSSDETVGPGDVCEQAFHGVCALRRLGNLFVGQAFNNAFSGVTSTLIRWGLAVSAFGSVIVSTPRL